MKQGADVGQARLAEQFNHSFFSAFAETAMQEAQRSEVHTQNQGLFLRWRDAWLQRQAPDATEGELGLESALPWLVSEDSAPASQP